MARARSQEFDSVKQSILDAAARLFATKGFEVTSISEIADAAKMSKAGVYHYFDTKSEILRTILTEHLSAIGELVDSALNTSEPPRAKFVTLTRLLIENYSRPVSKSHHTVLLNELHPLPVKDRDVIVSAQRRIVRATERLIQSIFPQLKEDEKLARPLTMLYFGMINWTDTWYSAKGPVSPNELATLAAEVFLNGIAQTEHSGNKPKRESSLAK